MRGTLNTLSDVPGIHVGHAQDIVARTGVSVIQFDSPMRCAVNVRGGGPATRETSAVGPEATLGIAHAITLSGGSVFGLAAADAVATRLSERGLGYAPVKGVPPVPIVPAAALYDLANGGEKAWGIEPPYARLADAALDAFDSSVECGSIGAGYGAVAGAWLGGLGSASFDTGMGVVAAMIAVNSIGSPVMPGGECLWAWPFEIDGEFGGGRPDPDLAQLDPIPGDVKGGVAGIATCIGVVAISVPLSRSNLLRIAIMAQDGLARAIRPSHAPFDGDTIFVVCPTVDTDPSEDVLFLGSLAADCVARAVGRGIWHAGAKTDRFPMFRRASV